MSKPQNLYSAQLTRRFLSVLAIAGLLFLSCGIPLTRSAQAEPVVVGAAPKDRRPVSMRLPDSVERAVRLDAARYSKLPLSAINITQAERRTWSDGCLGLGGPAEICAQALVPGWLVKVKAGSQRFVYHTNASGSVVRLNRAASQF